MYPLIIQSITKKNLAQVYIYLLVSVLTQASYRFALKLYSVQCTLHCLTVLILSQRAVEDRQGHPVNEVGVSDGNVLRLSEGNLYAEFL